MLDKYHIGALAPGETTVEYEQQGDDDAFYLALKVKVDAYFRDNKVQGLGVRGWGVTGRAVSSTGELGVKG